MLQIEKRKTAIGQLSVGKSREKFLKIEPAQAVRYTGNSSGGEETHG
jgi:hypothetical protein